MSGGSWEYVMGNYNDVVGESGFTSMPNIIYYDKYTTSDENTACNGSECLSQGLSETSGWYDDYYGMVSESYPWLVRGGHHTNMNAGIFVFSHNPGNGHSYYSFRLVLSPSL